MFSALCLSFLIPVHASAQFDANQIRGKTFTEVNKILGTPKVFDHADQSPTIIYATYNTPGAVDTIVWFAAANGLATKMQVIVLAKTGETYQEVLKRYHLTLGDSPKWNNLQKPSFSLHNGGPTGTAWQNVFISYIYTEPFKPSEMKYCKAHNLKPYQTYFWTIQVQSRGVTAQREMGAATDTGGGKSKSKGGRKRGK